MAIYPLTANGTPLRTTPWQRARATYEKTTCDGICAPARYETSDAPSGRYDSYVFPVRVTFVPSYRRRGVSHSCVSHCYVRINFLLLADHFNLERSFCDC